MSGLEHVAEAVADGLPVDWMRVESDAADDTERARLTELRLIAGIAGFHSTLHSTLRASGRGGPAEPPPTEWGTLRVDALLGRGAYGDVYRAWDPRLDRAVALKLIRGDEPEADELGAAVIEEGKLQAQVRHPGVVTIYGADRIAGQVALWMELVEGGTLEAELRERGPLPEEEIVRIGIELCQALEAVHAAGLLHRDIKTQNVMRDVDGRLVLGDFGTGQPLVDSAPAAEARDSVQIAGTPLYLAPELFDGGTATPQGDIYSLGVLLYHLATGSYPVGGRTVGELRAAHQVGLSLPVSQARPELAAGLATVIADATDPKPARRPESARDLRGALEKLRARIAPNPAQRRLRDISEGLRQLEEELGGEAVPPAPSSRQQADPPVVRWSPWAAAVVAAGVTGLVMWNLRPEPAAPTRDTLTVTLPPETSLVGAQPIVAALSANGRDLVYVAQVDGRAQLFHRPLDSTEARAIPGTADAVNPFFSPDGRSVGFKQGGTIRRVALDGGESFVVAELPDNPVTDRWELGMTWDDSGTIWFGHTNAGLFRVPETGGTPEPVTTPGEAFEGVSGHFAPAALPGGRGVLYVPYRGSLASNQIAVYDVGTGDHRILANGSRPQFAPSGHVIFNRANTVWALPFDVERLTATGDPVPVREGVRLNERATTQAYLGADGTLLYVPDSGSAGGRTLVWVDRDGSEESMGAVTRRYDGWMRISPDGSRVAFAARRDDGELEDIYVHDLDRASDTRITDRAEREWIPIWTPDGQRVVFAAGGNLMWTAADGAGEVETLVEGEPEHFLYPAIWSPDESSLLVYEWDRGGPTGWNVATVATKDGHRLDMLLASEHAEGSVDISPDGRLMTYATNESGRPEVYVTPYPEVNSQRIQVSIDGGLNPVWSPAGGGELFFQKGIDCDRPTPPQPDPNDSVGALILDGCRSAMMAVTVTAAPTLEASVPEPLFEGTYYSNLGRYFDVTADGQRFLMIKDDDSLRELVVVRNWVEELKERVLVP